MAQLATTNVTVTVPATSANLGPGFDVLGLALQVHNTLTISVLPTTDAVPEMQHPVRITVEGEGTGHLALDVRNLAYRSVRAVFVRAGEPVPALSMHLVNKIPVGRGLGSSAAAIVGGVVAANAMLGQPFSREELLERALTLEPHPDNLAAALYGGVAIAVCREGALPIVRTFAPAPGLMAVLLIPATTSSTAHARTILPRQISRTDAVFNMARTALLVHALATGDVSLLGTAMEDRLHQPQRGTLFPALPALISAARSAGAHGAALSGAGSTVLALTSREAASEVGRAMLETATHFELNARTVITKVSQDGATAVMS